MTTFGSTHLMNSLLLFRPGPLALGMRGGLDPSFWQTVRTWRETSRRAGSDVVVDGAVR